MTPSESHLASPTDTPDQVYRALSHPARRRLLLAIQDENPRTVEEIAGMLASGEREAQDVAVGLQHVHLPKLAEASFIEWTPENDTIERGPRFDDLRSHLDVLREHQ